MIVTRDFAVSNGWHAIAGHACTEENKRQQNRISLRNVRFPMMYVLGLDSFSCSRLFDLDFQLLVTHGRTLRSYRSPYIMK